MTQDRLEQKNVKLCMEFDMYMAKHPEMFEDISNKAWIAMTVEGDEEFNQGSVSMIRNIKSKRVVEAHKKGKTWSLRPLQVRTN